MSRLLISSTVHMRHESSTNLNLQLYNPHPSLQTKRNSHKEACNDNVTQPERWNCHQTIDRYERTDLASYFARDLVALAPRNIRHFAPLVHKYISIATIVCAHGTTIYELVAECNICALRDDMDYMHIR